VDLKLERVIVSHIIISRLGSLTLLLKIKLANFTSESFILSSRVDVCNKLEIKYNNQTKLLAIVSNQ